VPENHLKYILSKGPYIIDCSTIIFKPNEILILQKYGHWFTALTKGILLPFTDLQADFVLVANYQKKADTIFETTWFKYLGRKTLEAKKGLDLTTKYFLEDDNFHNREMAKEQKRIMFDEMKKNHKS